MLSPVQVLAHGRAVSLYIIFAFLLWRERKAADAAASASVIVTAPAAAAVVKTRPMTAAERARALAALPRLDRLALHLMTPDRWVACKAYSYCIGIGILNTIAYSGYIALTSLAEVSLWTALVGLFAVLPVCWGIIMRGESRTPRKLLGVALCIVAGILLGMSGANGSSSAPDDGAAVGDDNSGDAAGTGDAPAPAPAIHASMFIKLCLYSTAVVGWALSDGMSTLVLAPPADAKGSSSSTSSSGGAAGAGTSGTETAFVPPAATGVGPTAGPHSGSASWSTDPWAVAGSTDHARALAAAGYHAPLGAPPPAAAAASAHQVVVAFPPQAAAAGIAVAAPASSAASAAGAAMGDHELPPAPLPLLPPPLRLNIASISLLTGIGFSLAAAAAGGMSMITTAIVPLPVGPGTPPPVAACFAAQSAAAAAMAASWSYVGGLTLLFAAQFLGKVAWWACTQVGQLAEVSAVIPLVSLDVFVPVLLSILLLGEQVGAGGYVGFVIAAIGVTLISLSSS